jgi:hypothetical protein
METHGSTDPVSVCGKSEAYLYPDRLVVSSVLHIIRLLEQNVSKLTIQRGTLDTASRCYSPRAVYP